MSEDKPKSPKESRENEEREEKRGNSAEKAGGQAGGDHSANYIARNGIVCALYIVLTVINPIGWGGLQLRFSEALAPLPFHKRKYVPALLIGVTIANLFNPEAGPIDAVFGLLVGLISYFLSGKIKNNWLNCLQYSILSGLLIALELKIVAGQPFWLNTLTIGGATLLMTLAGNAILNEVEKRVDL